MLPGEFIRRFRKQKGISATEMARLMGVDYWRLQKWESGKGSPRFLDSGKINAYFKTDLTKDLSEDDLNKVLSLPYDRENGLLQGTTLSAALEVQLQGKERRIKELEDTVKSLQIALEAMKMAMEQNKKAEVEKDKKMAHQQMLSALVKKGYENLTEDERSYWNSVY